MNKKEEKKEKEKFNIDLNIKSQINILNLKHVGIEGVLITKENLKEFLDNNIDEVVIKTIKSYNKWLKPKLIEDLYKVIDSLFTKKSENNACTKKRIDVIINKRFGDLNEL